MNHYMLCELSRPLYTGLDFHKSHNKGQPERFAGAAISCRYVAGLYPQIAGSCRNNI